MPMTIKPVRREHRAIPPRPVLELARYVRPVEACEAYQKAAGTPSNQIPVVSAEIILGGKWPEIRTVRRLQSGEIHTPPDLIEAVRKHRSEQKSTIPEFTTDSAE